MARRKSANKESVDEWIPPSLSNPSRWTAESFCRAFENARFNTVFSANEPVVTAFLIFEIVPTDFEFLRGSNNYLSVRPRRK